MHLVSMLLGLLMAADTTTIEGLALGGVMIGAGVHGLTIKCIVTRWCLASLVMAMCVMADRYYSTPIHSAASEFSLIVGGALCGVALSILSSLARGTGYHTSR